MTIGIIVFLEQSHPKRCSELLSSVTATFRSKALQIYGIAIQLVAAKLLGVDALFLFGSPWMASTQG